MSIILIHPVREGNGRILDDRERPDHEQRMGVVARVLVAFIRRLQHVDDDLTIPPPCDRP